MNITILNGNPDVQNQEFDRYLDLYKVKMHNTGNYVRTFMLRDMKISDLRIMDDQLDNYENHHFADDFRYILNSLEETDLLIVASPLENGFLTVLTKMVLDRLTKVLQPTQMQNLALTDGKTGKNKLPLMGLIMQKEPDTSESGHFIKQAFG